MNRYSLKRIKAYVAVPILIGCLHSPLFAQVWTTISVAPFAPVLIISATSTGIAQTSLNAYSSADCSGVVEQNKMWSSGDAFPIRTGTHTYYLSTTAGASPQGGATLAHLLCPGGVNSRSVNIDFDNTITNVESCTSSSGCLSVTCSNTDTVASITSSNLTLTCP